MLIDTSFYRQLGSHQPRFRGSTEGDQVREEGHQIREEGHQVKEEGHQVREEGYQTTAKLTAVPAGAIASMRSQAKGTGDDPGNQLRFQQVNLGFKQETTPRERRDG